MPAAHPRRRLRAARSAGRPLEYPVARAEGAAAAALRHPPPSPAAAGTGTAAEAARPVCGRAERTPCAAHPPPPQRHQARSSPRPRAGAHAAGLAAGSRALALTSHATR
eukprot:353778-Chlamydomonas_euryale.AAC.4